MQNPFARRAILVVLMAAIAVLIWQLSGPKTSGPAPAAEANRRTGPTPRPPAVSPDDSKAPESKAESLVAMQKSRLDSFFIPEVGGNQLTLTESLQRLEKAFNDACRESREERPPLSLEVRNDPGARLTFSFSGTTFASNLRHLAALAGMEVMQKSRGRNAFVLVPAKKGGEPGEIKIGAPVKAARELRELSGLVARPEFTSWNTGDPFAPQEIPPTPAEFREILRLSGLCQEPGYDCGKDASENIIVTAGAADLRRLKSAGTVVAESHRTMKLTTRLIASDLAIETPEEVMDAPQVQMFLRNMAQKVGTDLAFAPSVMAKHQESVNLEIIKPREAEGQADWTGMKVFLVARLVGWKIAASPRVEIRADEHRKFSAQGGKDILLKDGETAVVPLTSPDKATALCLFTFQRVDATGRPVDAPREPEQEPELASAPKPVADNAPYPSASSVPGNPGMVFSPHSNKIVDVRDIPSGTLVADPSFPAAEKKYFRVP